jgi:hypothetical protein
MSLVRWRTGVRHHDVQQRARDEILLDYHLRVGQLTRDTQLPSGCELREQRLDETEAGYGTAVTFVTTALQPEAVEGAPPDHLARQRACLTRRPVWSVGTSSKPCRRQVS